MINITANGDIIATGDVLYKTEPVSIPQDTLIPTASKHEPGAGPLYSRGQFYHERLASGPKYRSGRQHRNHFAGGIGERVPQTAARAARIH